MIKCFSYQRYSSAAQASGTSIARQSAVARRVAKDNGLEYVEIFDRGVSAFKGKNAVDGKLGEFINDVRSNKIPNDCWLIVENLDRLTRQNAYKAFGLMSELIELGVTIVTGNDNRKYCKETMNDDLSDLFMMILEFSRGHNESKVKSQRTFGHAAAIVKMHRSGVRSIEGFALAIESIGNNMWWSQTFTEGTNSKLKFVKQHPLYFSIAKEIIDMLIEGCGNRKILNYLNAHYAPPIINRNSDANYWSHNLIANFHKHKALYGEKTITINSVKEVIENYYPILINKETFLRIGELKANRQSISVTVDTHVRLLSGMQILKCGHCGGSMHGLFTKGKYLRYKCTNGQANKGCLPWSFNALYAEDTLLRLAANNVFKLQHDDIDFEKEETILRSDIAEIQSKQNKIVAVIESTDQIVEPLLKRMMELTALKKVCMNKLEKLQVEKAKQEIGAVEWDRVNSDVLNIKNDNVRLAMKERIRRSVRAVICTQIQQGHISFSIEFINGKLITANRKLDVLAFDGDAWDELGNSYSCIELDDIAKKRIKERYELDDSSDDQLALQQLMRMEHVANWGGQYKFVPKIIEDKHTIYKHPYYNRVMLKEESGYYYLDSVDWLKYHTYG